MRTWKPDPPFLNWMCHICKKPYQVSTTNRKVEQFIPLRDRNGVWLLSWKWKINVFLSQKLLINAIFSFMKNKTWNENIPVLFVLGIKQENFTLCCFLEWQISKGTLRHQARGRLATRDVTTSRILSYFQHQSSHLSPSVVLRVYPQQLWTEDLTRSETFFWGLVQCKKVW